ncbi:MAG: outer membrane protein assembly factor BamC, partial [Oceanospirillaceae bacterium]
PKQGTIESDWIVVKADQIGVVDSWLKKLTFQNIKGDNKNKIQIKLTTDKKNLGRTIISMAHVRYSVDQQVDKVNWASEANNISYKTDMLYELLRFMSKTTSSAQSNTLLASNFKRSQRVGAVLFGRNANGKPALKISGSLDNTWSLVANSLDANQIDVGTQDRATSTFYLTFTSLTPLQKNDQSFLDWLHGDRGPITLSSFGFSDEANAASDKNISYSSKGQTESNEELAFTDPNHPANQAGFKVWLAGKVIYNFNRGFNKGFFNADTNMYQTTAGYQLKLTHRGAATFITVMDKQGKEAATIPAEELLWRIKDSIPRS